MTQILCTTWWHSFGQEMELVNYRWIGYYGGSTWFTGVCGPRFHGDFFLVQVVSFCCFSRVFWKIMLGCFRLFFKNTFHANVLGDFDMVIGLNWIKKHVWWRIAPLSKKTAQCRRRTVQPSTDGMDFVNCVLNLTWDLPIYRWFIGDNNPFIGKYMKITHL